MRRVIWVLAGCSVLLGLSMVWLVPGFTFDFSYEWLTAKALIYGVSPYGTIRELAETFGLKATLDTIHPRVPGALVLQAPLGLLPFQATYVAGRILTVASAYFLAWVFARLARVPVLMAVGSVPLALLVWPFASTLRTSQTGFLVAALLGSTWMMVRGGDSPRAGIPLGIAVVLKLWPWMLVVALAVGRKSRAATGAMAVFVGFNLVGLALPHVSVGGVMAAMQSATIHIPRSLSVSAALGVSPYVGAAFALALIVLVGWRWGWSGVRLWSIPLALAAAPILWAAYLPALVIPVGDLLARRAPRTNTMPTNSQSPDSASPTWTGQAS